ncbi:MAG TPA: hypothetical protein VK826_09755 [Bacteroidia bacterium]|nr:hypothetical protein [Bacteroidia bacterium]
MKKYILVFALLFALPALNTVSAQTATGEECKPFRTGTFYNPSAPHLTITRDSLYQVETDTRTGDVSKFKVTWVDDCTYKLEFIESTDREVRKAAKVMGILTVTITSVEEGSYKFRATSEAANDVPMRGTMLRKEK